jgi:hypothetical protein
MRIKRIDPDTDLIKGEDPRLAYNLLTKHTKPTTQRQHALVKCWERWWEKRTPEERAGVLYWGYGNPLADLWVMGQVAGGGELSLRIHKETSKYSAYPLIYWEKQNGIARVDRTKEIGPTWHRIAELMRPPDYATPTVRDPEFVDNIFILNLWSGLKRTGGPDIREKRRQVERGRWCFLYDLVSSIPETIILHGMGEWESFRELFLFISNERFKLPRVTPMRKVVVLPSATGLKIIRLVFMAHIARVKQEHIDTVRKWIWCW